MEDLGIDLSLSGTLAYAEIELQNDRKPLSKLIQSVC